jgi:hypothetical protein
VGLVLGFAINWISLRGNKTLLQVLLALFSNEQIDEAFVDDEENRNYIYNHK